MLPVTVIRRASELAQRRRLEASYPAFTTTHRLSPMCADDQYYLIGFSSNMWLERTRWMILILLGPEGRARRKCVLLCVI